MILYTMMPRELIFPYDQTNDRETHSVMVYNDVPVLVEHLSMGECRIVRILSTDPNHFLDQSFQPGEKISFPMPNMKS
ncbi:YlzJ-like family protein [Fictibacillus gelatini]|uniref:YlzJ-like family protein n=1 Tax=Fictibacillus gelatini TaxID=225985 RepID=UPI00040D3B4B|nr:YlzJ-like family protein [Fictibacillus gelatini]